MSYYRPRYGFGRMLTPMVKNLLIINIAVFLLESITGGARMIYTFGLVPQAILHGPPHWTIPVPALWQFFTYMFLHGGFWHIFLNMFVLYMFGSEIERYWGSREFLKYYFLTGVGAGILSWLTAINSPYPTIGASGAIYGILVAYGMMFPNRPVYLYFMFPVKAKYMVVFLAIIELLSTRGQASSGIAHFAHLGGMLFGYLYLKREHFSYLLRDFLGSARNRKDPQRKQRDEQEQEMDRKVDEILQKISREGRSSLSREEEALLDRASRRYH